MSQTPYEHIISINSERSLYQLAISVSMFIYDERYELIR